MYACCDEEQKIVPMTRVKDGRWLCHVGASNKSRLTWASTAISSHDGAVTAATVCLWYCRCWRRKKTFAQFMYWRLRWEPGLLKTFYHSWCRSHNTFYKCNTLNIDSDTIFSCFFPDKQRVNVMNRLCIYTKRERRLRRFWHVLYPYTSLLKSGQK